MQPDWGILLKIFAVGWSTLMSILGFLAIRTLNKIDSNQTELFNRVHSIEKDFYELRGEHYAHDKGRCRQEDHSPVPLYQHR